MSTAFKRRLHQGRSWMVQQFLLTLCRLAYRPKVTYASEKARAEAFNEPSIILCNHVRGMDGAVIYAALHQKRVTALAAKDMKQVYPILKVLYRLLPVLEIDREHVSLSWLRESRQLLRQGHHIMIFAEGRCNRARIMRAFKPGAALLAVTTGAKVVPVYHNGCYHPFIGARFRVIVGEPITLPAGGSPEALQADCDLLRTAMQQLEMQLNGFVRADAAMVEGRYPLD